MEASTSETDIKAEVIEAGQEVEPPKDKPEERLMQVKEEDDDEFIEFVIQDIPPDSPEVKYSNAQDMLDVGETLISESSEAPASISTGEERKSEKLKKISGACQQINRKSDDIFRDKIKSYPCLWDHSNPYFKSSKEKRKCRQLLLDSINEISKPVTSITVDTLRNWIVTYNRRNRHIKNKIFKHRVNFAPLLDRVSHLPLATQRRLYSIMESAIREAEICPEAYSQNSSELFKILKGS